MIGFAIFDREYEINQIDHDTEFAVRRFLELIEVRYDISSVIVYGSCARGTRRPDGDADVAILLRGVHHPFLSAKLQMADVALDVLLETGMHVSPLAVWLDEWENPENYSNPSPPLKTIGKEGVRLRVFSGGNTL